MKVIDFMNAAGGHITGGAEYQWKCYPDAEFMEVSDDNSLDVGSCIYNRITQEMYEIDMHDSKHGIVYLWVNPEYLQAQLDEAKARRVNPDIAYDDVMYTRVLDEEKILPIVKRICNNIPIKVDSPVDKWPFVHGTQTPHVHGSECNHDKPNEHDDGPPVAILKKEGCCGSCTNGNCQPKAEEVDVVDDLGNEFKVTINVAYEFDINASTMEEAVAKGKEFTQLMKPSTGWADGLSWIDSYYTRETVERNLVNTSYSE